MKKIGLFYGSNLGATEEVAHLFKIHLKDRVEIHNIAYSSADDLEKYDNLILGLSTWGYGDPQDDWQFFLEENTSLNLAGKNVAIFGLGDQDAHHDVFVNGMGHLYNYILKTNAKIVGQWPTEGYSYGSETTAVVEGKFVGLPIDEINQPNLTKERVRNWIDKILEKFEG